MTQITFSSMSALRTRIWPLSACPHCCLSLSSGQEGADLGLAAHVLAAGAQAGLDRDRLRRGIADQAIRLAPRNATDAAHDRGVFGVPTLAVGDELFWGDDRIEDAAAHFSAGKAA